MDYKERYWSQIPKTTAELETFLTRNGIEAKFKQYDLLAWDVLLYRPRDNVVKFLIDIITRLRNEDICRLNTYQAYFEFLNLLQEEQSREDKLVNSFIYVLKAIAKEVFEDYYSYSQMLEHAVQFGKSREKIKFLLLDEAQDLNPISLRIIKSILPQMKVKKVIILGDKLQNINGFIGAIKGSEEIKPQFDVSDVKQKSLPVSYRLDKNLVDFVNKFLLEQGLIDNESLFMKADSNHAGGECKIINYDGDVDSILDCLVRIIKSKWELNPNFKFAILSRSNFISLGEFLSLDDLKIKLENKFASSKLNINDDAINVSTIHRFKGLEADFVFLLNATSDEFPFEAKTKFATRLLFKENEATELMDAKCLFYVAITRAKHGLYFLIPKKKKPSLFFPKEDVNIPITLAQE